VTLAAASTQEKAAKPGANVANAQTVGKLVADRAKKKSVSKVVFDRGGFQYQGKVKALADAAREAGLEF
jgi:large subunit ribosomal protein L18